MLKDKITTLPPPGCIGDLDQLTAVGNGLTRVLWESIEEKVTWSKPQPDTKRWWNSNLSAMRKDLNGLRSDSYKNRAIANHPSHRELRTKSRIYGKAIISAK